MKKSLLSALAAAALMSFAAPASAEVLIGVAAPITGPNAAFGAQIQRGAEKAIADINAAGGINGEQIRAVIGDDVSDPRQGVSVANKFIADGVGVVVAHYNSGVAIPSTAVYADNGVLAISPAATNPTLTDRGLWNTFRVCGRDDQQGAVAASHILANLPEAKVAVIHDKTPYGQGLADVTRAQLIEGGKTPLLYEGVNAGDKDFSALIAKIKEAGVDFIYFGGLHTEAGLIIRQLADQGLKVKLMSGDGIVSNELAAIAGDAIQGTLMTFAPDPRQNPNAKELVEQFRAAGFEPEAYTLYSYAILQLVAQAAEKSKSTDPETLAATLKSSGPFTTVIGDLSFDEKGDITRPDYIVYQWVKEADGKFTYEPVQTAEVEAPAEAAE